MAHLSESPIPVTRLILRPMFIHHHRPNASQRSKAKNGGAAVWYHVGASVTRPANFMIDPYPMDPEWHTHHPVWETSRGHRMLFD